MPLIPFLSLISLACLGLGVLAPGIVVGVGVHVVVDGAQSACVGKGIWDISVGGASQLASEIFNRH